MKHLALKNFRIIDADTDVYGTLTVEDGFIKELIPGKQAAGVTADLVIDGAGFGGGAVLMPAFVDLHAHFRDPGFPEKETLESASLAAAAGGFGTVVCMANTKPVIDTAEKAADLSARSDRLGFIDLYPVMSLTQGMEGRELSGIAALPDPRYTPRLFSEDGKDVSDDELFLSAMAQARRLGIPISCHCDFGGTEAEGAKAVGKSRDVWSRIEENNALRRVIDLGRRADAPIHIAHVSTKEAVGLIRQAKAELQIENGKARFTLTCEASPHHLALTSADTRRLGDESRGRVNPPLREEEDREALMAAITEGLIDAVATDHAPHSDTGKEGGAPGFTGLETAFGVCVSELVRPGRLNLSGLSALMSRNPARILKLEDRGLIKPGFQADLVIVNPVQAWLVEVGAFKSRGNNSPFTGWELTGKILMTIHRGQIVFMSPLSIHQG